jgi:hypothetical protein
MSHMKNRDSNRRRREDRQVQAKVRQEAYDKLSLMEKLAALPEVGAAKQHKKLLSQVAAMPVLSLTVKSETEAPVKEKKGAKAKRQHKHDKKASK